MKKSLFLEAADILLRTQAPIPEKLTPRKVKFLQEAARSLQRALLISLAAPNAAQYGRRWQKYWREDVVNARNTLLAVANGTYRSTTAVAKTANLCASITDNMNAYS